MAEPSEVDALIGMTTTCQINPFRHNQQVIRNFVAHLSSADRVHPLVSEHTQTTLATLPIQLGTSEVLDERAMKRRGVLVSYQLAQLIRCLYKPDPRKPSISLYGESSKSYNTWIRLAVSCMFKLVYPCSADDGCSLYRDEWREDDLILAGNGIPSLYWTRKANVLWTHNMNPLFSCFFGYFSIPSRRSWVWCTTSLVVS